MTLPLLLFASLASHAVAPATQRPYALMPGDVAPALAVREWVKGDPVTRFEPGQVYVIDFWATWCGPCKKSMPALSAMQHEYGDKVVFVALNTWDYADHVAPFVAEMGDKLDYRVAIDEQSIPPAGEDNIPMYVKAHGTSTLRWLSASGLQDDGIPVLCVVDRSGKLAWVGYEPARLKPVLDAMLAGTWDLDGYAASYTKDAAVLKQGRTLERRSSTRAAERTGALRSTMRSR